MHRNLMGPMDGATVMENVSNQEIVAAISKNIAKVRNLKKNI